MNPAIIEQLKSNHQKKVKQFYSELQQLSSEARAAFDALQKLLPQDIERVYLYTQRFQTLVKEQERLKPYELEPTSETFVVGTSFGWIAFWIEDCQSPPSRNLSRIPYKQCKECGQAISKKNSKSFCSGECAEAYRKWRDNVKDVAKRKDPLAREIYIREKALTKYRQQMLPLLVTVSEKAWQLACQIMQEHYAFIPVENTLPYIAQQFKIVEWLLRHYVHRRVLEPNKMPDLTLKADEIFLYQSPEILYRYAL